MKNFLKVLIAYKNSKASGPGCGPYNAGGLSANALHSRAVLLEMGVPTHLLQADSYQDIVAYLNEHRVSHVIVEAIWMTADQTRFLAETYPAVQFVVRSHSKMGFLQVEPEAVSTMRRIIGLSETYQNLTFSSNNSEFAASLSEVYGETLYLPNLYDLASAPKPKEHPPRGVLKIASFGASRLLKLHPSAALAALQIANRLDRDLEFYVNTDRTPGGDSVRKTMCNMFAGIPRAKLIEVGWQDVDTFKETISTMDLVIQLSATETFCLVAADAVAGGVPVVAGPAIKWIPEQFRVDIDETEAVARMGVQMLRGNRSTRVEEKALHHFVRSAKEVWHTFLKLHE